MTRLTSLEDKLFDDPLGRVRQELLTQLIQTKQMLERQLRQPNSADHHRALTMQLNACVAATHVVDKLWQRYHGG